MNLLPMPRALARAGLHVLTCCTRYPNNDTNLLMEKCVKDVGPVLSSAFWLVLTFVPEYTL
jgi:hypothetical protein